MTIFLSLIIAALSFTGYGQSGDLADTSTYQNGEYGISFQYPANWELADSEEVQKLENNKLVTINEKFEHAVVLHLRPSQSIFFDYDSDSFDTYESNKTPTDEREIGGFLIEEMTLGGYPAKRYTEYGITLAGIAHTVEKNGRFLEFSTDFSLSDEDKKGIEKIVTTFTSR